MDLGGLLDGLLKDQAIETISKKTGLDSSTSKDLTAKALPILLGALKGNANDSKKSKSLEKAVAKNDGSVIDNLKDIDLDDGAKIVKHIFGDKTAAAEKAVGDKSILAALAPMVMGALGKANSDTGLNAKSLLSSKGIASKMAISFLDKDGDGDIKDDILTMILNFFRGKKKK